LKNVLCRSTSSFDPRQIDRPEQGVRHQSTRAHTSDQTIPHQPPPVSPTTPLRAITTSSSPPRLPLTSHRLLDNVAKWKWQQIEDYHFSIKNTKISKTHNLKINVLMFTKITASITCSSYYNAIECSDFLSPSAIHKFYSIDGVCLLC